MKTDLKMAGERVTFISRLLSEYIHITNNRWSCEDVGRHWDAVTDYDEINSKTHSYFRRFVDGCDLCRIPDNSRILDICSRTGNGTAFFFEKGKVKDAVCADVSQRMQSVCREALERKGVNLRTVLFRQLPLPFEDEEFDAVLCFETVEHMPEPHEFIFELKRVLKRGGELVLTTPNILWGPGHCLVAILNIHHSEGPHRFLKRSFILKAAMEAGLMLKRERTSVLIPAGPEFLIRSGEAIERAMPEFLRRILALRRIFIFERL